MHELTRYYNLEAPFKTKLIIERSGQVNYDIIRGLENMLSNNNIDLILDSRNFVLHVNNNSTLKGSGTYIPHHCK